MNFKGIVLISGIGTRELKKEFKNAGTDGIIEFEGKRYKINAAAATALKLSKENYFVYTVDKCGNCIRRLSSKMQEGTFQAKKADLLDKDSAREIAQEIENLKEKLRTDVHYIHYGSVSATKVEIPNNSLFLDSWQTPGEASGELVQANIAVFYNVLQSLKEVFNSQEKTKIIIISSLAAIRAGSYFGLDAIQKGAVHSMARTAAIELAKENIFVTEIMPGTTDTGYYDNEFNLSQKIKRAKDFGYELDEKEIPIFSSMRVAETVHFCLETPAHIREISLIPFGQHPHLGA